MMIIRTFEAFAGYGSQLMAMRRLERMYPECIKVIPIGISEIDKNAITAYQAVHGDVCNYGDIRHIEWDKVPDFDLFTMSSPCQDFSTAGLQMGGEEGSGTRSSLLWECRKAILAKKPKYVVFENVKGLLSDKFRPFLIKWANELQSYGYSNFIKVLNAIDYGIPQNRERVFMVSILGYNKSYNFPKEFILKKRLKDILEKDVDESYFLKEQALNNFIKHSNMDFYFKDDARINSIGSYTPSYTCKSAVLSPNGVSITLLSSLHGTPPAVLVPLERELCENEPSVMNKKTDGIYVESPHRLVYGSQLFYVRKLTERELFRLMDVDDSDIDKIQASGVSRSGQQKISGNSIVVSCLYHIFRKLFVEPNNEDIQLKLF